MDNQTKETIKKMIQEGVKSAGSFTARKLTDVPTDALSVVSRKYVTLNGTSANRPKASVLGQHYFDTSLGNGKPVWWNGTGFVDATGTYV